MKASTKDCCTCVPFELKFMFLIKYNHPKKLKNIQRSPSLSTIYESYPHLPLSPPTQHASTQTPQGNSFSEPGVSVSLQPREHRVNRLMWDVGAHKIGTCLEITYMVSRHDKKQMICVWYSQKQETKSLWCHRQALRTVAELGYTSVDVGADGGYHLGEYVSW